MFKELQFELKVVRVRRPGGGERHFQTDFLSFKFDLWSNGLSDWADYGLKLLS